MHLTGLLPHILPNPFGLQQYEHQLPPNILSAPITRRLLLRKEALPSTSQGHNHLCPFPTVSCSLLYCLNFNSNFLFRYYLNLIDQAPVPPLCSLMRWIEPYDGSVSSNFSWLKNWKENKKSLQLNCVKDKVCNMQILQIEGLPIPLLRGLIFIVFELQSRGNGQ